ncbi:MAG TPA: site-specific DNA-methyltransferase [Candidatus Paceibacterota bacterium]|nr:site-specific DNA-methyltransferase [Candidatus Paceibacterota bacterium]
MTKDNKNLEVENLKAEIERLKKELKKRKKYGLVWEEKPEEVVEMCREKLPVLKEVKNKEIITDKDKPVNLLIEGDNYHALSVLNYTHAKKVDVIYIDPPYNTGNKDFIFNDRYIDKEDAYRHSKWLSFMEKRLKLAKNLLKDDGVIFISIDDNEVAQLKLLLDDKNRGMFGENNLESIICWRRRTNQPNDKSKMIAKVAEFLLVYAKNSNILKEKRVFNTIPLSEVRASSYSNPDNDPRGPWSTTPWRASRGQGGTKYKIKTPTGKIYDEIWLGMRETFEKLLKDKRIVFPNNGNGKPRKKVFLYERQQEGQSAINFWFGREYGDNLSASAELNDLFGGERVFDNPKPVNLIKMILRIKTSKDSLILDFMAGTGTTGQAVLDLNKEDGGNRQFILCTNNENNICTDVCYPRIKKVIKGYKNLKGENINGLGGNLKYFKTDFVDYDEPTDRNKIKLTQQATDMLCVKEGTFEKVVDNEKFKIFKNLHHYTGIIWDQTAIPAFKKAIEDIKGEFSVYVFSLGDETFDEEFEDACSVGNGISNGVKQSIKLSPIPEAILRVYRRIFN